MIEHVGRNYLMLNKDIRSRVGHQFLDSETTYIGKFVKGMIRKCTYRQQDCRNAKFV
jgi:hypothetical protein